MKPYPTAGARISKEEFSREEKSMESDSGKFFEKLAIDIERAACGDKSFLDDSRIYAQDAKRERDRETLPYDAGEKYFIDSRAEELEKCQIFGRIHL
jgi:hypothetical protein